jgi:cytochrome P450
MRLKPVAPFIALKALRDSVVGDVAVPRGTQMWGVLRRDSVSERHFARPAEFEPQRWLDDAAPPLSAAAKRSAMPFGSGPRMCPGRYLALLEMKMAMAMLLSSFDIEAVDTPDGQPAQERMAFTMNPVGLSLRLRERS